MTFLNPSDVCKSRYLNDNTCLTCVQFCGVFDARKDSLIHY